MIVVSSGNAVDIFFQYLLEARNIGGALTDELGDTRKMFISFDIYTDKIDLFVHI